MAISRDAILAQIDAVLGTYEQARRRSAYDDTSDLGKVATSEAITRLAATIDRLAPPGSQYRENAKESLKRYGPDNGYNVPILVGALKALRADYESGHLHFG